MSTPKVRDPQANDRNFVTRLLSRREVLIVSSQKMFIKNSICIIGWELKYVFLPRVVKTKRKKMDGFQLESDDSNILYFLRNILQGSEIEDISHRIITQGLITLLLIPHLLHITPISQMDIWIPVWCFSHILSLPSHFCTPSLWYIKCSIKQEGDYT